MAESGDVILVIEDETGIRNFMQSVLEDEGLEVVASPNGHHALEAAAKRLPALIVLDWELPDMDGERLVGGLRQQLPRTPPVLLVSADGNTPAKAERAGAYAYLNKPFSLDSFLDVVAQGLARPPTSEVVPA
jgi:two-component system KDP operon response regulator KdpE